MTKYSVIIPFHSNQNLLTICVNALRKTLDLNESEIIIVDNNASGSQIEPSWELEKYCTIIRRAENLMYPSAINLGVEYARGEYLLFCDADTCVTPNFHKALTGALRDEEVGYAAAKLLNIKTGDLLEFGITSSYINFPHPYAGRPRDFELVMQNHHPLAACAACSAIRRDLFTQVGGFDEELVHAYSDIDLCLRIAECGYKTICVADALAFHCGASTVGSGMGANLKEDTKGIFMSKHPHIPVQIVRYIDAACDYFRSQNPTLGKDYFIMDCSTIINAELYLTPVMENLGLSEAGRYHQSYPIRDANEIDLINFIPYQVRNYRVPILYFADSFVAFKRNKLWKDCRAEYDDIVVDRHANIELLRNI